MSTAFLITAFDELKEVRFTLHMLRKLWESTKESPVVVVISGDRKRELSFPDDPYTRVVHVDDAVERPVTELSTELMRTIEHGMLEIKSLERTHGKIDEIVHMAGDVLLLDEQGFRDELNAWRASGLPVGADSAVPQDARTVNLYGEPWTWAFFGTELIPQLFVVDHDWCQFSGFMYHMEAIGMAEQKSEEWALIGNLHRAAYDYGNGQALRPTIDPLGKVSPYQPVFDELVYVVKKHIEKYNDSWGLLKHWGGHFRNSEWYAPEHRKLLDSRIKESYGIDWETFDAAR